MRRREKKMESPAREADSGEEEGGQNEKNGSRPPELGAAVLGKWREKLEGKENWVGAGQREFWRERRNQ